MGEDPFKLGRFIDFRVGSNTADGCFPGAIGAENKTDHFQREKSLPSIEKRYAAAQKHEFDQNLPSYGKLPVQT